MNTIHNLKCASLLLLAACLAAGSAYGYTAADVPNPSALVRWFNTDDLPATDGAPTGNWTPSKWDSATSSITAGTAWTSMASPTVAVTSGVKWVNSHRLSGDGFDGGSFSSIACPNGMSLVTVIKPTRNTTGDAWNSIVDLGTMGLTVGVRNNTGNITVFRKGTQVDYASGNQIIPDGQKTVLSCIFQPDGSYKIYANGIQIVVNTSTGDPNLPLDPIIPWYGGVQSNNWASHMNLGRTNGAGWATFNGLIGDTFIYTSALSDTDRGTLEGLLTGKFLAAPHHTITASADAGGTITPSGAVQVDDGASQTFTIAPATGFGISTVLVDGTNNLDAVGSGSYTFSSNSADHTIAAEFYALPTYTITASANPGGTITPAGVTTLYQGQSQTYTITASLGSAVSDVLVDGSSVGAVTTYPFSSIAADHTIAVTFAEAPKSAVSGQMTDAVSCAPIAGATVFAALIANAAVHPGYTVITDSAGNYTVELFNATWYLCATQDTHATSVDITVTVGSAALAGNNFTLVANGRNIPAKDALAYAFDTNALPADGAAIATWPLMHPMGPSWPKFGGCNPVVTTLDGVKWETNHNGTSVDGFDGGACGSWACPLGASYVMAIKPLRNATADSWDVLFDIGCMGLTVGVRNNTGALTVFRKGHQFEYGGAAIIPDGQKTVLSLVVQPDGEFKIWSNGVQLVNQTATSPLDPVGPNYNGPMATGSWADRISLARNSAGGWSAFNGAIGDTFIYRTALSDADRQTLQNDIAAKFGITMADGTPPVAYADWMLKYPTADLSDPAGDYDGDGMINQQEYAFGLNPTSGSSVNPISVPFDKLTGKFRYTRTAGSTLTYTVWTSTNLQDWTKDTAASQTVKATADGVETVEVGVAAAPVNGKLFVRVQAVQP